MAFLSKLSPLGYTTQQLGSGGFEISRAGKRLAEVWTDGAFARMALSQRQAVKFGIPLNAAPIAIQKALNAALHRRSEPKRPQSSAQGSSTSAESLERKGAAVRGRERSLSKLASRSTSQRKQAPDYSKATAKMWEAHLRQKPGRRPSASTEKDQAWHGAQAKNWRKMTDLPFLTSPRNDADGD